MPVSVLYIDDELPHLILATEFLGSSGDITITCVGSGKEAIEILQKQTYDVIVSDYMMQDMDGIQILQYVRTNYGTVPFILFTGKGKEDIVIAALNSGADYYIRKGTEPQAQFSELKQRILQAHHQNAAKQELAAREQLYHSVLTIQTEFFVDFLPDLTIIKANEAYAHLYGTAPNDQIGMKFMPDMPEDERATVEETIKSLSTENPISELQIKVGASEEDFSTLLWYFEAVFGQNGKLVSAKATGRDISDEQFIKAGLKESELKYQETATDLPKGMGDFDENVALNFVIENTRPVGTWKLRDMVKEVLSNHMNGVASATGPEGYRIFIIFINGEPEGGIYMDRNGVLYGDKSTLFLKDSQQFTMYKTELDVATRFITGCRIYDKTHIRARSKTEIPDIGKVRKGLGNITIKIESAGRAIVGMRITVKSSGKIVGNDTTNSEGHASFQLLYGNYTGVLHSESGILKSFPFEVESPESTKVIDLKKN